MIFASPTEQMWSGWHTSLCISNYSLLASALLSPLLRRLRPRLASI